MTTDSIRVSSPFRPKGHPHTDVNCCPNCRAKGHVSLPAYPSDWFDCELCGHSWEQTDAQKRAMGHKFA